MSKLKKRPSTKAERKAKKPATLPLRFEPKFLEGVDGRQAVIREVKRRLEKLKEDTGCDSFQKELLCERAVHISTLLQTQELNSYDGQAIDVGVYTQMTNALVGLRKALGLNKSASSVIDLREYVVRKGGGK